MVKISIVISKWKSSVDQYLPAFATLGVFSRLVNTTGKYQGWNLPLNLECSSPNLVHAASDCRQVLLTAIDPHSLDIQLLHNCKRDVSTILLACLCYWYLRQYSRGKMSLFRASVLSDQDLHSLHLYPQNQWILKMVSTLVLLSLDIPRLYKQCISRSVGF